MTQVPHRLVDLLAEGKIVPFVGSGFSIPSGAPSWYALVKGMLGNFAPTGKERLIAELSAMLKSADVAEILDSISPTEFAVKEYLIEQVDSPKCRPTEYHEYLVDLQCNTIVTTNWDTLIESEMWQHQQPFHVVYRDVDVAQFDPDRATQLLKIHGTITDPESVVYKRTQYEQFWQSRPLVFDLLSTLMATKSFLFMGYGFGDPNILEIIHKLKNRAGRARREHYAIAHEQGTLSEAWRDLGVNVIDARAFDPVQSDPSVGLVEFLHELGGRSRAISVTNRERARLINDELESLIKRTPPKPCLRMRGALGWLSNPIPIHGDPVYGTEEQDVLERQMTELIFAFLDANLHATVKCILHIDSQPLLRRGYKRHHLVRRLETLKEAISRYPSSIQVVHDDSLGNLNQMLFDDHCSLLGFKRSERLGIDRTVLARNRAVVRSQARAFDADFEDIQSRAREAARARGTEPAVEGWARRSVIDLIDEQLRQLSGRADPSASLPRQAAAQLPSGTGALARALEFACRRHAAQSQTREDGITPYGVHIIRVVERLRCIGLVDDYDILAAGALHDLIEDCGVSEEDLTAQFGSRIAGIVREVSKKPEQTAADFLAQIRCASPEARTIKLADRWDNITDLRTFRKPRFGRYSSEEYLRWSQLVVDACADANARLAESLKTEIDLGIAELGSAKTN